MQSLDLGEANNTTQPRTCSTMCAYNERAHRHKILMQPYQCTPMCIHRALKILRDKIQCNILIAHRKHSVLCKRVTAHEKGIEGEREREYIVFYVNKNPGIQAQHQMHCEHTMCGTFDNTHT